MRWNPSFFRKSALFWPVAHAAARLEKCEQWPNPDELTEMFVGEPPVRFERARPKPRRRHPSPADARYDARIVLARRVPTRPRSWHDVSNALVWATFPRAKLALHARQHRLVAARVGPDMRLPGSRTREQDAIAMLDEGGVVLACARSERRSVEAALARDHAAELCVLVARGAASAVIFGHAIYEGLACERSGSVRAAAYVIDVDARAEAAVRVGMADAALAALLSQPAPVAREAFASVAVDHHLADATSAVCRRPGSHPR